ncbi:hypothetical protein H0H81_005955 [Sphagnurus paluster]|uniref:F-box domain-containing protein n=1 Tax=Sphagnurus paluster TaxID=117069 RepID=A0A9P7GLG0_9AGAR|nr:hypothetical protein H0H81_005955 [Sphagnurus paluster]
MDLLNMPVIPAAKAQLSIDLFDIVMDQLEDDEKSLRNCALVSPTFLFLARKRLFRSIYLEYRTETQIPCARLMEFLTTCSEITPHIRKLHVVIHNWLPFEPSFLLLLRHLAENGFLKEFFLDSMLP